MIIQADRQADRQGGREGCIASSSSRCTHLIDSAEDILTQQLFERLLAAQVMTDKSPA